jgi:Cu(I)/Ag(I) efflux system membrane fusion protein
MAFNNNGAYWVQKTKTINNPYFGASMLKCGEIKEKL